MAQQIRYLYNELREPRNNISLQALCQILTRTFDALDTQNPTSITNTTNVTQIVAGLWTQTGNFLYPTVTSGTNVLVNTTSWDGAGINGGVLIAQGPITSISASTNASYLAIGVTPLVETTINSAASNSGTVLPMSFFIASVRAATILTTRAILVGISTTDLATTAGMIFASSTIGLINNTSNASTYQIHIGASLITQSSSSTGSGTILPLTWLMASTEIARFTTAGTLLVGLSSSDFINSTGNLVASGSVNVATAATNASVISLSISAGNFTILASTVSGTGTQLPLTFKIGSTEAARFTTAPNFLVGLTSSDFPSHNIVGAGFSIVTPQAVGVVTAAVNASTLYLSYNSSVMFLVCDITGTGTQKPMGFMIGTTEAARFDTNRALLVGLTSSDLSAAAAVITNNLFAVVTATANASFWAVDIQVGVAVLIVSSVTGTGTQLPMAFRIGSTEVGRFTTGDGLLLGITSSDFTSGLGDLVASSTVNVVTTATNASVLSLLISAGNFTAIASTKSGTGTQLALAFRIGGSEVGRFTTGGGLLLGLTSSDFISSTGNLVVSSSTAVASAATNASVISMSLSAGNFTFLASTVSGTGTQLPLAFRIGGTTVGAWDTSGTLLVGNATSTSIPAAGRVVASKDFIVATAFTGAYTILDLVNVSSVWEIRSDGIGGGSAFPIMFRVGGTEVARCLSTPRFLVNQATDDGTGATLQVTGSISVGGVLLTVP